MTLEHLWAGWRSAFVNDVSPASGASEQACVFCTILASGVPDTETHIVWRHPSGQVVAILNVYPYTSGHLMVMPIRHVADLESLTGGESAALWEGITAATAALKAAYRPHAMNLGANVGKAAGAGVPGHLHMHVVPRWAGDTNFMTTVAGARVLPEALPDTDRKLRDAWPP
jgi:ATP adenylyltransferase